MSGQSVQEWLEGYWTAWVERDAEAAAMLFTETHSTASSSSSTLSRAPRACATTGPGSPRPRPTSRSTGAHPSPTAITLPWSGGFAWRNAGEPVTLAGLMAPRVSHFLSIMFRRQPRLRGRPGFVGGGLLRAWAAKSGGDDDPAELDGHVVVGRFGFRGVPASLSSMAGHVVGAVTVQCVPDGDHAETDQPRTARSVPRPPTPARCDDAKTGSAGPVGMRRAVAARPARSLGLSRPAGSASPGQVSVRHSTEQPAPGSGADPCWED